jgi:hypothetical protein
LEILRYHIWIIVVFTLSNNSRAQDSTKLKNIELTRDRTAKVIEYSSLPRDNEDSLWYIGKEYEFLNTKDLGTPFFFDEMKFKGSLVFNGRSYSDLILFYDLVRDELVLHAKTKSKGSVFIILNKAWISEFSLEKNNEFFRFLPDSYFNNLLNKLPEGFLEVSYDNKLKLLFKYSKKIHFENNTSDRFNYNFEQNIYLIKENKSFEITSKSKFLSVFPEHKKQINAFLRKSQFRYKNATRSELISLIEYCEKLS